MKSIRSDVWLAFCVMALAAVYLYMDMRLPEVRLSDPLGPKAFPALVGVGLISSALLLLFEGHRKARHAAHAVRPESGKEWEANGQKQPKTATPKVALEAQADASGALHRRTSATVESTATTAAGMA